MSTRRRHGDLTSLSPNPEKHDYPEPTEQSPPREIRRKDTMMSNGSSGSRGSSGLVGEFKAKASRFLAGRRGSDECKVAGLVIKHPHLEEINRNSQDSPRRSQNFSRPLLPTRVLEHNNHQASSTNLNGAPDRSRGSTRWVVDHENRKNYRTERPLRRKFDTDEERDAWLEEKNREFPKF